MKKIRYVKNSDKITFSNCGLDIKRNCLVAPVCECGCGEKPLLVMTDKQDVVDTCASLLLSMDCCQCGIFVIFKNGNILVATKLGSEEDDLQIYELGQKIGDHDFSIIGDLAIELSLHIYGLMVETDSGNYKIIED